MKKITNWDRLKDLRPGDTTRYRDVYDSQQLERSHLKPKQTMKSRIIADVALTIFYFFAVWIIWSMFRGLNIFISREDAWTNMTSLHACVGYAMVHPSFVQIFVLLVSTPTFYGVMYLILKHNLDAQNLDKDMSDVNQYPNDQHVALPAEIQRKFDWFPDVGATSDVQFSSMISHVAISNKGLDEVMVAKRAEKDVLDEDGNVVIYKGEPLYDDNGNLILEQKPLIDIGFMHALYDASGLPRDRNMRRFYDTRLIPYNGDGSDRDKLGKYKTVADLINADWQLPWYEPQRPAGAYLVDTAPVNTMVLAIS